MYRLVADGYERSAHLCPPTLWTGDFIQCSCAAEQLGWNRLIPYYNVCDSEETDFQVGRYVNNRKCQCGAYNDVISHVNFTSFFECGSDSACMCTEIFVQAPNVSGHVTQLRAVPECNLQSIFTGMQDFLKTNLTLCPDDFWPKFVEEWERQEEEEKREAEKEKENSNSNSPFGLPVDDVDAPRRLTEAEIQESFREANSRMNPWLTTGLVLGMTLIGMGLLGAYLDLDEPEEQPRFKKTSGAAKPWMKPRSD